MKRCRYYLLLCLVAGCSLENEKGLQSLPGVYATYYTDEFSKRFDTVFIEPVAARRSEAFRIEKRSSASKVFNHRIIPEQRRIQLWDGPYDPRTGSIRLEPGKNLYFDGEKGVVTIGQQRFQKVKMAL